MSSRRKSRLDPRKKYLQVALNSTLEDARSIIHSLPVSDRIIIEAGTPLIKEYGADGIRKIVHWYRNHVLGTSGSITMDERSDIGQINLMEAFDAWRSGALGTFLQTQIQKRPSPPVIPTRSGQSSILLPYVVADLKTMDRGEHEVRIAADAGATAAIALGQASTETLNAFIAACEAHGLDAMIDMMNVEYPLSVLRALKKLPHVVILHRGVDEETFNKEKQIPYHEIQRIKGSYDMMLSIAGGDTIREVQRSIFNGADIAVIWKSVYHKTDTTADLVAAFLKEIK